MPQYPEQRKYQRVNLHRPIVVHWQTDSKAGSGTVSNMSPRGCYVLTQTPARMGELIGIRLGDLLPEIEGAVRYVDQDVGMGVEFVGLQRETLQKLEGFVRVNTGH